jgi:hypothetical protein
MRKRRQIDITQLFRYLRGEMSARLTCVAVAVFALGCSKEDSNPSGASQTSGTVQMSISPGSSPTVNWTPAIKLFLVLVEPDSSGADVWAVISDSTNAISPPVTYGVTPAGAREMRSPATLTPGVAYKVILFQWTGPGRQDGKQIGRGTFIP